MAKKGNEGTTLKQRLNGNEYALNYANQLYKLYDMQDILTAGIIALSWLSPEAREKAFNEATEAETGSYLRVSDIKNAVSSDSELTKARRHWLKKYFEQLEGHQQNLLIVRPKAPSSIEKSG